jgi:hypothetical protein
VVATLLTILTAAVWMMKVPRADGKGRQCLLFLFVPATVWAWEASIRECYHAQVTWINWPLLDLSAAAFALAGLVAVFFYWLFK